MGIRDSSVFPVMCIAAKTDQGVTTLMDFIKDICPVPHEMPYEKTKDGKELKYDSKEAPRLLFLKQQQSNTWVKYRL